MAGKKDNVNLDALIPREDLGAKKPANRGSAGIPVTELAIGRMYYSLLRKPHFQRETDDWSIDNVVALIKAYRDGHLIPAVILWNAEGYTFVIDGAHRLGALIAWVNDDYGDRLISGAYFKDISKRQREIATACRKRIADEVGTFSQLSQLASLPSRTAEQLTWSTNLSQALETQWVVGDAKVAATSFLAINQRGVPIDRTERYMIEHMGKPNVLAARALVRSARGHAYWGMLEPGYVSQIEKQAVQIYTAIFEPEDAEPAKSAELQPGGPAHTANGLRLALDMVNVVNAITGKTELEDDKTGEKTARFIEKAHAVVKYIAGKDSASLNLHPAVYFWGETGNHRPSIFLAVLALIQEMVLKGELVKFTIHRARLEELLIGSGGIAKQILGKHGGWKKSLGPVKEMLRKLLDGLEAGKTDQAIEAEILGVQGPATDEGEVFVQESTWRQTKASLRHQASLASATRCAICKARLVLSDASDDHKTRRTDGGQDNVTNAQLTHHYCNHGFKEYFAQKGQPLPDIAIPQSEADKIIATF